MFLISLLFLLNKLLVPPNICDYNSKKNIFPPDIHNLNILLNSLNKKNLNYRINYWTSKFMNTRYVIDPLGEGEGTDPDPRFNICSVDCETFVEQVLALSFSKSGNEIFKWLDQMRYRNGMRKFKNRYYTMVLDWIPWNLKLGYLKISNQLISNKLKTIKKYIDPGYKWAPIFRKRFALMGSDAPKGTASIQYVPMSVLGKNIDKIKLPALGFIVGAKQIKNPFLITHMGFILKNSSGKVVWRHASRSQERRKVEERIFKNYLISLQRYFNKKKRRFVEGMIIYTIIEPSKGIK